MSVDEWFTESGIDPSLEYSVEIKFLRDTWAKAQEVEREECAKVAEDPAMMEWDYVGSEEFSYRVGDNEATMKKIADAIRARGNE